MCVCGEADGREQAREMAAECAPDIAVIDLGLRDSSGLELVKDLQQADAATPILVLSTHDEVIYAERALNAGARGYLCKSEPSAEVMRAIRKVLAGEVYVNQRMAGELIQRLAAVGALGKASIAEALVGRELEVFQLIGEGKNTRDIARELRVSESTVATVRTRVKEKVGAKDLPELYHLATAWMNSEQDAA